MSVQFADGGNSGGGIDYSAFASRAKEIDVGSGMDDIVELGDDMGINLLSNPNKVAASPRGGARQVNFGGGGGDNGGAVPSIQIRPVDDIDAVNLEVNPGVSDIRIQRDSEPAPFVINTGNGSGMSGGGGDTIGYDFGGGSGMNPEEERRQKQGYLAKLQRLDSNGMKGQRMTMSNSLEEIKSEYDKLTDGRNLEASIRFQRNALMTFVTGVEMVNDKFGNKLPIKPRLKGWSESVHTNVEDFDDIFEELYDMYKDKAKVHPMLRLVGTLGVSATMYHLTNSMAERSGVPGMSDLLNENPELQRQFAAAMAAKMGGLGQFMSAAGGFGGPQPMGSGPQAAPMYHQQQQPPTPPRNMGSNTRVPFGSASAAAGDEAPRARREMRGPSGVDDIIKAFETERFMQQAAAPPSGGVFAPSGPPPSPPSRVQILREGVGSGMDPLSEFGFPDDASIGTSTTMNTERRRGRKKAVATPVGATLDLNV
jgi:hypothetical protein